MKRSILGLAGMMALGAASATTIKEKPNVLFIFADDQTFESLNCLNNSEIKTPNINRLKKRGVVFTHAFNQGSWCPAVSVASRTMLNTGKYLWNAAVHSKKIARFKGRDADKGLSYDIEYNAPQKYWADYMSDAGYETYFTGKWHVEKPANKIFDHTSHIRGGMPNQTKERYKRKFIEGEPDTWSPYDKTKKGFWKGGKHWSEVVGDDAVSFLNAARNDDQPFFIYAAFNAPHDPRQSPKRFVDMYPLENISVPKSFIPEYPYCEDAASGRKLRDERLAPFPRTEYSVKVNRQEYYAIITHMDEQIGRILDALEASGKADNTYIFFTADHGLAVGDHGFLGKQNMYDRSIRVPLLMAGPGVMKDKEVDANVYLQDIMATSLDLAKAKNTGSIEFNSLMPLATGKKSKTKYKNIYGAYMTRQRMIRTDKYKMIIYPSAGVVRLYDIINDPEEMKDLAVNKKKYKKTMNKLFKKFKKLQKQVGDPLDMTLFYNKFFE